MSSTSVGTGRLVYPPHLRSVPTVPTEKPSYLRLHRPSTNRFSDVATESPNVDAAERFWSVFTSQTGWRVDSHAARRERLIKLIPSVATQMSQDDASANPASPIIDQNSAMQIATAAAALAEQYAQAKVALNRSGVKRAADAWSIAQAEPLDDAQTRIQSLLSDAVAATGTTVAVLSMLDDDTQSLTIVATFGLPDWVMAMPPRVLRGSRGDLEAMVNRVVAADDFRGGGIDTWNAPLSADGSYQSGLCVAIESGDVPIGTLWLLSHQRQTYGIAQSAAARLTASALQQELSKVALDIAPPSPMAKVHAKPIVKDTSAQEIGAWQQMMLPHASRLAPNWLADGMIESPLDFATGFHSWDVLPDGTLMIAIAEATESSLQGAMIATLVRSAIAAHGSYRHNVADMIRRVSDTMWQTGSIQSCLSLMYGNIDPEDGSGRLAVAGNLQALVAGRYGYRPLCGGGGSPIGVHVDCPVKRFEFQLQPGESLIGYGHGWIRDGIAQHSIGSAVFDAARSKSQHPLAALRRSVANIKLTTERGAISLTRSIQ
jgi:phosphoserine phosphatase RsbU/P